MADNGEAVPSRSPLTRSTSYIPYGEVFVEESSAGWKSPYYFNSKELDEETGLYYYGARYLNPTEARWLSVDPKFEKYVGMSPYNYCAGNPVKYVDPQGEEKHICFYIPPLPESLNQKEFNRNKEIRRQNIPLGKEAKKFPDNKDVILFFGHGIQNRERSKGIQIDINGSNANAFSFETFLANNSTLWLENERNNKKSVIFLFSCAAGKGEGSIAEIISKELEAIVIAPSETIIYNSEGIPIVYEEGLFFNEEGTWNVFYNGKVVDKMNGYDSFFNKAIDIADFIKNLNVDEFVNATRQKYLELNK